MKTRHLALIFAFVIASGSALALEGDVRKVPARDIPIPDADVSPATQALIAAPLQPIWNEHPKDAAAWKALIDLRAEAVAKTLPDLRARLGVKVEAVKIGGVNAFMVTPDSVPEANRDRLLVHVHGGGYVFFPGESGTREAILMAGYGKFRIVSIDYRMPPDHPYPAALDDIIEGYRMVLEGREPGNIAFGGVSAGGGLSASALLKIRDLGLALPGAAFLNTPMADLSESGDTFDTNALVDSVLIKRMPEPCQLYAGGHDLKDPYISAIYGEFHDFPPTILIAGTRDLFLSNTVLLHRAMLRAGVEAELHVFEAMPHGGFGGAPEDGEAMMQQVAFLDSHLGPR